MRNLEGRSKQMDEILWALEELLSRIKDMDKRDRCRYYCRDRGNHHHMCDYSEN